MRSKIIIVGLSFIFQLGFLLTVYSQPETSLNIPGCTLARVKPKPAKRKTITAGVLNGVAVVLPKPEYPAAALAVHVSGTVQINVLIDEAGCVEEAKAVSGHPLLIVTSLKAARTSIFEPVLLSGQPVRVTGMIIYRYVPNQMNWLELGNLSESYADMMEYLPAGFEREQRLLRESDNLTWDEKTELLRAVNQQIRTQLISSPKDQWLFMIGNLLRSIRYAPDKVPREIAFSEIRLRLNSMPGDISLHLKVLLEELITLRDATTIRVKVAIITDRLFDLGN